MPSTAMLNRCLLSAFGMSLGLVTSSRAWASRVWPSGEMLPGVVYGLATPATWWAAEIWPRTAVTADLTAGEVTAASEWMTTSTVSPDCAGKRLSSSCWAALESEPGAE